MTSQNNVGDGPRFSYLTGNLTISGATISNNGGYGLYGNLTGLALNLQNSAITNNAVAAHLPANTTLTNINWTGNTRNEIEWAGGTLNGSDRAWQNQSGINTYRLIGDVTVGDGITLTIDPGMNILFNQYVHLYDEGNLRAIGTAVNPITFTAPVTTTGYWGFIQIGGGSVLTDSNQSQLSYATIDHGGYSTQQSLYVYYAAPTFDHLTVQHSGGAGLSAYGASVLSLDTATIGNNGGDGMYVYYSPGFTLTNVSVSNNGGYGVELYGNTGSELLQNVTAQNNTGDGLRFDYLSGNMTIAGATVTNNGGYGLFGNSPNLTLNLQNSAITNNAVAAQRPPIRR